MESHAYTSGSVTEDGPVDLFDGLVTVKAKITNTGSVAGAEVAQLYLGLPEVTESPAKKLRGFQKVFLDPGESRTVNFVLQRRDLSVWDTVAQKWKIENDT